MSIFREPKQHAQMMLVMGVKMRRHPVFKDLEISGVFIAGMGGGSGTR